MKLNGTLDTSQMQWSEKLNWLPILMYHQIVDDLDAQPDPYNLNVSVAQFESQMEYLNNKKYQSVHLDDVAWASQKGDSPWIKPVVITFDDGYMDTYTKAFPILQKYGLTATVLLVSGQIGGTNVWDHGEVPYTSLMGTTEIREMAEHGIGFGSHTVTHRPMTELSYQEAQTELVDSKRSLEDLMGHEMKTFAFPYGKSNPVLMEMTQEAGYIAACGIEGRENTLFNLSRVDPAACNDNWLLWRMKMTGTHYKLRQNDGLRKLKSFLTRTS